MGVFVPRAGTGGSQDVGAGVSENLPWGPQRAGIPKDQA